MANKYSKGKFAGRDDDNKPKTNNESSYMSEYEKRRERLSTVGKVMAILVALAMLVTGFLSSGMFNF